MADDTRTHHDTIGFGFAAIVAILFNTVLTCAKESYAPLLAWMKAVSPHHWITHSLLVLAVFFVCGWLFSNMPFARRFSGTTLAWLLFIAVAVGSLGIFGFYLDELVQG